MLRNTCFPLESPFANAVGLGGGVIGRRALGGTNAGRAGADEGVERKRAKGSGRDKLGCGVDEVAPAEMLAKPVCAHSSKHRVASPLQSIYQVCFHIRKPVRLTFQQPYRVLSGFSSPSFHLERTYLVLLLPTIYS